MNEGSSDGLRTQILPEESSVLHRWVGNTRTAVVGGFTALMFGVAILVLSLLAVTNPMVVFPKEMAATGEATLKTEVVDVKYYLPYPGILPDSPLYKLKMVRDKVSLMMTMDPMKKSQKELLFADKRINAAWTLAEGGKQALGVSTASKAEIYLADSANIVIGLQKSGQDVKSQLTILQTAAEKHIQILNMMGEKVEGDGKVAIERTIAGTESTLEKLGQALKDSK